MAKYVAKICGEKPWKKDKIMAKKWQKSGKKWQKICRKLIVKKLPKKTKKWVKNSEKQ